MAYQRVRPSNFKPARQRPEWFRPTRRLQPPSTVVSVTASVLSQQQLGGLAAAQLLLQDGVQPTATVGNGIVRNIPLTGGMVSSSNLGGTFLVDQSVRGGVVSGGILGGAFTLDVSPNNVTIPEARRDNLTHRPFMPLVVYGIDIEGVTDLMDNPLQSSSTFHIPLQSGDNFPVSGGFQIPIGGSFLLSANYLGISTGEFEKEGAQASYIGTLIQTSAGTKFFTFRKPRENEVVWYVKLTDETLDLTDSDGNTGTYPKTTDKGLFRFRNGVWESYRGIPERWYKQQDAVDLTDPDSAVEYFSRLISASYYQVGEDTEVIRRLLDSDNVPDRFIFDLGRVFDIGLRETDSEVVNRRRLRGVVDTNKRKGLPELVRDRLRQIGFVGYANVVWVNPIEGVSEDSEASISSHSISQTSISGGTQPSKPFSVWHKLEDAPFFIRQDARNRGVEDQIEEGSGQKGQDVLDKPPDWHPFTEEADFDSFPYVASSRLSLHLNFVNGKPLKVGVSPFPDVDDARQFKEDVARELAKDILPSHVDIRFWKTDIPQSDTPKTASDDVFIEFTGAVVGGVYSGSLLGGTIE